MPFTACVISGARNLAALNRECTGKVNNIPSIMSLNLELKFNVFVTCHKDEFVFTDTLMKEMMHVIQKETAYRHAIYRM